jgi:hypothetical protein
MLCQTGPNEHVMQQSPRRLSDKPVALAQQHRQNSAVNKPQNPISFVLRPVSLTIKTQVMSFFNSLGCAILRRRRCSRRHECLVTDNFFQKLFFFSCTDVLCNARALEGPNAPQLQPPLHLQALLRPTTCPLRPHQRQSQVPRSPCIFAVRLSKQHLSRETSRRSSCCQNTSISWNGSP